MTMISINGKFLGAPLNGVHRTAALFSKQLVKHATGEHRLRILSPSPIPPADEFPDLRAEVAPGHFGSGQGWEMITLPRRARRDLLVNFCNLAPLLHGNSVVMIHDAQTFLYPEDYTGRQAAAYRKLLPLIARRARRILTVSGFARDSLVAHGVGIAEKFDVIHNGTDHLLHTPADGSVLSRFALQPGRFVMTLGSAKGYKNIRTVFEAMAPSLPSGHGLVVAGGPGENAYRKAGWRPPPGTIFTGFVSDAELRALYGAAAAFVFPSLTEGFGLPPVEAMHCGTAVIAARAGAMPEVCADGALLVDPQDPGEVRKAIIAVTSDTYLAAALRARGARRASQLSWEAAGARLWQCLSALV